MIIDLIFIYKKDFIKNKNRDLLSNYNNDYKKYVKVFIFVYSNLTRNSIRKNSNKKCINVVYG